MLLADLHIHTTWSDGKLSIAEVVDLFGRSGHDVIAITDHGLAVTRMAEPAMELAPAIVPALATA